MLIRSAEWPWAPAANLDGVALPRELVNHSEHPEPASMAGRVPDEVIPHT